MRNNNMYWFTVGFCSAVLFAMMISCTISPLEASVNDECGQNEWNPCYVKVVN